MIEIIIYGPRAKSVRPFVHWKKCHSGKLVKAGLILRRRHPQNPFLSACLAGVGIWIIAYGCTVAIVVASARRTDRRLII